MKRFFLMICCFAVFLTGCLSQERLRSYYENQSNYVTVTGTVSHIAYDEEETALYIGIAESPEGFSDTTFKLIGDGLSIARENGIDEILHPGDETTFAAAPRYFGDGYVIPVAAIEVEGVTLLGFDEGYAALMDWIKER